MLHNLSIWLFGRKEHVSPSTYTLRVALFAILMTCPILCLRFFLEPEEVRQGWTLVLLLFVIPGLLMSYVVARCLPSKYSRLSYIIFYFTIVITWIIAVNINSQTYSPNNYYLYLPTLAFVAIVFCFDYVNNPFFSLFLFLTHGVIMVVYPLYVDPNAWLQLPAFVTYGLHVLAAAILYIISNGYISVVRESFSRKEQLDHANRLSIIGRTASSIAHDYNNLLSIAIYNLEMIDRVKHEKLWKDNLENAEKALEHAAFISQKLLKMGQAEFKAKPINLKSYVEDLGAFLQSLAGDKIQLIIDKLHDVDIMINPHEFEAAIVNLVMNAKNAMNDGTGRIVIFSKLSSRQKISLSIQDNGKGIPEKLKSQIFEPYFSTKSGNLSSGLGLSIVKDFIQKSGGNISFESEPGNTVFTLEIPIFMDRLQSHTSRQRDFPKYNSAKVTLIVDDNLQLLETTSRLLHTKGVSVYETSDWDEAIDLVKKAPDIELAFLDFSMPQGNGIELGAILLALKPSLSLYVLTGGTIDEKTRTEILSTGFKGVLNKPLSVEGFLNPEQFTSA